MPAIEGNVLRGMTDDYHEMVIATAVADGSMTLDAMRTGSGRGRRSTRWRGWRTRIEWATEPRFVRVLSCARVSPISEDARAS
jgi:hypothetical protein